MYFSSTDLAYTIHDQVTIFHIVIRQVDLGRVMIREAFNMTTDIAFEMDMVMMVCFFAAILPAKAKGSESIITRNTM